MGEICSAVAIRMDDWQLGPCKHHGERQVLQKEGKHGSRIGHGIRAVCNDDAVVVPHVKEHGFRHELPFLGLNVGAIHIKQVDAVHRIGKHGQAGKQLLCGKAGHQSVGRRYASNGTAGCYEQNARHERKPPCNGFNLSIY
ncbi:hypothetical protein SDC9_165393 [bioreactor metagenome]|uniref:Uncharacterized protein n=1 Tax=bioreactor metagenome TaxID=1076179 RepID=A0A645FUA2_9ZZZZ